MAKKIDIECPACGATGLYVGAYCHEGAAMVCRKCEGKAFITIEVDYKPFEKRKTRNVTRVFSPEDGWKHLYPGKHTFPDGSIVDFSLYGIKPEEFYSGLMPDPLPEDYAK